MNNAFIAEERRGQDYDTAIRSISTLRGVAPPDQPLSSSLSEPRALLADVQYAVRITSERDLRRVASLDAGVAFQPKVLLSVLTYCYVTGTYGSGDIEDLMRRDVTFRGICLHEFPSSQVLKRFRRENHGALRDCVQLVLQLRRQREEMMQMQLMRNDRLFSGTSGDDLMEEAEGRLLKAMFIDRMEAE
jgi:transposase